MRVYVFICLYASVRICTGWLCAFLFIATFVFIDDDVVIDVVVVVVVVVVADLHSFALHTIIVSTSQNSYTVLTPLRLV